MTETENLGEGRQVVRDPVTGQFQKGVLDPQTASEMNKARKLGASSVERLLSEQGYNQTDNKPPEYISVMAHQAIKHPAAMAHWRRVHSLADQTSEPGGLKPPRPGEQCPVCRQWNTGHLDGGAIADLLREVRSLPEPPSEADAGAGENSI